MSKFENVLVVANDIVVTCSVCGKVIARENFSLCVIEAGRHYLVGNDDSPKACCGVMRGIPYIFRSKEEAEEMMATLIAEIKEYGDTSHLSLFPLARVVSPTLH